MVTCIEGKMTLNEFCTRSAGCLVFAFTGHCHMFYAGTVDLRESILQYLRKIGVSEMFKVKACLQEDDVRVDALASVGQGLFLDRLEEAGGASRWKVSTDVRSNSSRRLQEGIGRGEERRFLRDVLLRQAESNIV
ncbi:uncharacterized protein LOC143370463 [Andrena cerasifolii]|uniref:uncharacterized protein LOC143370463 n=1 Tax=Andrena cerasifolii TaxID=2819439 RepID=UPI0040380D9D